MQSATSQAPGRCEAGATMRTDALGLKSVERLAALATLPEVSDRRRGVAAGASEAVATGQLRQTGQESCVLQPSPAIHQHEGGENAVPDGLSPHRQNDEPDYADETDHRRYHQAAGASEDEPEQGAEDLAAIERVDGKDVEDQQADVDVCDGAQEGVKVGNGFIPAQ